MSRHYSTSKADVKLTCYILTLKAGRMIVHTTHRGIIALIRELASGAKAAPQEVRV